MRYTGLNAAKLCTEYTVQAHAIRDGVEVVSQVETSSIKDYLAGVLADEGSTPAFRRLFADILNYGAAAQRAIGYHTDDLPNENLPAAAAAALTEFATQGEASATKTNSATGSGADLIDGVGLSYRVILSMQSRIRPGLSQEDAERLVLRVTDPTNETTLAEVPAACTGNTAITIANADYDQLGVRNLRDEYCYAMYLGDEPVTKTLTWSFEGYVKENRDAGGDALQLALLNATLIYGDSVINAVP